MVFLLAWSGKAYMRNCKVLIQIGLWDTSADRLVEYNVSWVFRLHLRFIRLQ